MKNLKEIYEEEFNDKTVKWWYYNDLDLSYLKDCFLTKGGSESLIRYIYKFGGKSKFFSNLNNIIGSRSLHMVSAFFMGFCFIDKISLFQDLKVDSEFPWLWFLCCLYHDAYFDKEKLYENEGKTPEYIPKYFADSNGLLYDKETIEKYRNYRLSNGKADHGIYAAAALSKHYKELFFEKDKGTKLTVNKETMSAVNKVAKVIACHNIFIAMADNAIKLKRITDEYLYYELKKLIPNSMNNCRMPKSNSEYEMLYLLLCLCDVLEPSKRGFDLSKVYMEVIDNDIILNFDTNDDCEEKYQKNILDMLKWLNYVTVSIDENHNTVNIKITIQ